LATILAASTVVMALPFETAKASRGETQEPVEGEMQRQAILNLMVMII
jgi:hypothetical protein